MVRSIAKEGRIKVDPFVDDDGGISLCHKTTNVKHLMSCTHI